MLQNWICFAVLTSDLIMSVSSSDNSSSARDTLRALMRSPRSPPQFDQGESSIQPQPVPPQAGPSQPVPPLPAPSSPPQPRAFSFRASLACSSASYAGSVE